MKNKGQLLIEALIALGVGTTIVVAVGQLVGISFRANFYGANQVPASGLSQECLEALASAKKNNWNYLYFPQGGTDAEANKGEANPYHPEIGASGWEIATGEEIISLAGRNYRRKAIIENVSRTQINGQGDIEQDYELRRRDPATLKVTCVVSFVGGEIRQTRYLTRHNQRVFTQTDWHGGSGQANWLDQSQYFSDNGGINPTSLPGSVLLAGSPGAGVITKNEFSTDSIYGIVPMNNSQIKTSIRFTAQNTKQVQRLGIYVQTSRNPPTYRVGLQYDSGGNPTGNWLGPTAHGYGLLSPPSTGWQSINLQEAVPISTGTVYHIVVEYESGNVRNNRYIDLRSSLPLNQLVPINNVPDSFSNTLYYDGSWQTRGRQPIYYLGFSDASLEGNPYDNRYNPIDGNFNETPIFGSNLVGESFIGISGTISKIELSARKSKSQNPQDDLFVTLYNFTDHQVMNSGVLVGRNVVTQADAWYTYSLPAEVSLSSSKTYLIYLSSPGTSSNRCYYASGTVADSSLVPITFAGDQAQMIWSTNGGTNFNFRPEADLAKIRLISPGGYSTLGELISSSFDTTGLSGYLSIFWIGDKPAGTDIRFQIATCDDNSTWNFLGPDGTPSTYYQSSGTYIFVGASNHRYIRYRLLLTGDGLISPRLDEIKINYVL